MDHAAVRATMSDREITATIHGLLRLRHPKGRGEWATFEEFQPGTGASSTSGRRWDFLAVSCWGEGRGRRIVYEVKASRPDWLKELADPGKRRLAESLCHETWIASGVGVVESVAEVPEGWGWLEVHGCVLHCPRAATHRANVETPDSFVAALARRGMEDGEQEPPPPPRGAWRFAGRDIPEANLPQVCREIVDRDDAREVERQVNARVRAAEERVRRLEDMERILAREMGLDPSAWQFSPTHLEWWLRARAGGVNAADIAGRLERMAEEIRRLS
jgi:hypothetical protein